MYVHISQSNHTETKYTVVKKVLKNLLGFKILRVPLNQAGSGSNTARDWDLLWTDNAVQPEQLARLKNYQKINHFPGMYSLSRKNYLTRNIMNMAKAFPAEYDFYPRTWVLPSQLGQLRAHMQRQPSQTFIAKPEASCQGKGIFLTKSIDDFDFGEHYVVQQYLKRPLLIDGLKFDLRVYVLLAGCDPLRVYIYREGLARFATEAYSIPKKENLGNLFMHLTNYAINKHSEKFQFNSSKTEMDKGHKRSLTSCFAHLKEQGHDTDLLWEQIKQIILKTLISVQPILAHHYRSCQSQSYANNMCFEILGFDVIIDYRLKPSILQVNYTPSFSVDTPLDKEIKQNLIRDSIILMNITPKAKTEFIASRKRQMHERTLTGKKLWYSKQEREKVVELAQLKRDKWQNNHLGGFDKVFPLNSSQSQQEQSKRSKLDVLYKELLQFAEKNYQHNTGASTFTSIQDIKRNNKVLLQQHNHQSVKDEPSKATFQTADFKEMRQARHAAKANELEKIYKTKIRFRSGIVNRTSCSGGGVTLKNTGVSRSPEKQEIKMNQGSNKNMSELVKHKASSIEQEQAADTLEDLGDLEDNQLTADIEDGDFQLECENDQSDYSQTGTNLCQQANLRPKPKPQTSISRKFIQTETRNQKQETTTQFSISIQRPQQPNHTSQTNIGKRRTHHQRAVKRTLNAVNDKGQPQQLVPTIPSYSAAKSVIYSNKMVFKRPNSAANRKGVSTVYNLTFKKEISLCKNDGLKKTAKEMAQISQLRKKEKYMQPISKVDRKGVFY